MNLTIVNCQLLLLLNDDHKRNCISIDEEMHMFIANILVSQQFAYDMEKVSPSPWKILTSRNFLHGITEN